MAGEPTTSSGIDARLEETFLLFVAVGAFLLAAYAAGSAILSGNWGVAALGIGVALFNSSALYLVVDEIRGGET